jgi:hypothetical protein
MSIVYPDRRKVGLRVALGLGLGPGRGCRVGLTDKVPKMQAHKRQLSSLSVVGNLVIDGDRVA